MPARRFPFGGAPAPGPSVDAPASAERTTLPIAADAPNASPMWASRPTLPIRDSAIHAVATLPFRAPAMPAEHRDVQPSANARRWGSWCAYLALALVALALYSIGLGAILVRRAVRASVAVEDASVPTASASELPDPLPAPSLASPPLSTASASAEPPRSAPSASAPAVQVRTPRAAPSAGLPRATKRPPLPFGGGDVRNPWSYD
jgi:hypothetical protein